MFKKNINKKNNSICLVNSIIGQDLFKIEKNDYSLIKKIDELMSEQNFSNFKTILSRVLPEKEAIIQNYIIFTTGCEITAKSKEKRIVISLDQSAAKLILIIKIDGTKNGYLILAENEVKQFIFENEDMKIQYPIATSEYKCFNVKKSSSEFRLRICCYGINFKMLSEEIQKYLADISSINVNPCEIYQKLRKFYSSEINAEAGCNISVVNNDILESYEFKDGNINKYITTDQNEEIKVLFDGSWSWSDIKTHSRIDFIKLAKGFDRDESLFDCDESSKSEILNLINGKISEKRKILSAMQKELDFQY